MNFQDRAALKELDTKLDRLKHALEGLIPVWCTVDRRVKSLKNDIDQLESQRIKLQEGQLAFSFDLDF